MQSKKLFFIELFSIILAYALGTRLLNRNSVFNPENFVKKEGEKIDDLLEKQRLSQRVANQIKNKSKILSTLLYKIINMMKTIFTIIFKYLIFKDCFNLKSNE